MSNNLRRRVEGQRWAQGDWLPELREIEWDALERHRRRHADALAALEKARSDKQVTEAVRDLCGAVEAAVHDLRQRCAFTYSPQSQAEGEKNEWAILYLAARDEIERVVGGKAPVGPDSIREWIERLDPAPELIEAAYRREHLREDYDAWFAFQQVTLLGPSRLVNGAILPLVVAEAGAIRQELAIGAAA
jgi:hypothetical protein